MDSRSTWLKSCQRLLLLGTLSSLLFSAVGCQILLRGSGESRESKYSLKKRKSYISCMAEGRGSAEICRLPLKVPERSIDRLFSSLDDAMGTAYRSGGSTPDGFDCSGLVSYLYKQNFRMLLPRTAGEQALLGPLVEKKALRPGDLLFFSIGGGRIDHVGISIGKNSFAHAARRGVMISSLTESYYLRHYVCAARIITPD
ncbi:C40 family peptidase [Chlorobium sp. BLA1]|nr:C40 family peptidase [Candidatus Chlorobium masyuteum]NTU45011.1 C40 family peptidase [Chlorobiaceae bacterium]